MERSLNRNRVEALFQSHLQTIYRRTDFMFGVLMLLQYAAAIFAAHFVSPKTWAGAANANEIHVWAAVVLGGTITSLPVLFAFFMPGRVITRHIIAIGQILMGGLFIHLSGGRIETHFHIFGSLAFLGFYRDWKVLASASIVAGLDHYFRGALWPQSVYGVLTPGTWRWAEHISWIVFEDIFLLYACYQGVKEMREIAERRALVEQVAQERARSISELEETRTKLKDALQSKDEFMSICGHELKTPLTSLSLQTQYTKRAIDTGNDAWYSPDKVTKLVDRTESQVKRLLRLVQDMLDHSRLQMGHLPITPEQVDLNKLVREVIERFQAQAEMAGSPISFDAAKPVAGNWDPFRIEQVITNLISNAIKYGEGKPIEVSIETDGRIARVKVRDHGMGISDENQEKVFQQFERVAQSSHISGLGLGLYISKSIVERHEGKIILFSIPGEGSTFTIELPIHIRITSQASLKALQN